MIYILCEAIMDKRGIIYESYTLDRWTDPKRTDEFYQLTPGKANMPWEKIPSVGAGMQQTNSGPDGTPLSTFTGEHFSHFRIVFSTGLTGVRVGIKNSSDAVMTDFDIMYATFMYYNENGSLELPLVRGAAMLTHIFKNANPIITPYCLIAINGVDASFECPEEETKADKGTAYVEVSCNSRTGILSLVVHTTKPVPHVTDVQWAATVSTGEMIKLTLYFFNQIDYIFVAAANWTADHAWTPCSPVVCELIDGGMNVVFTLTPSSEISYFAANVHGQFIIETEPWNWRRQPKKIECPWVPQTPQEISVTNNAFVFELQEPGDLGLTKTRKFAAYFDKTMTATVNDEGLFEFQPQDGGPFTGLMQLVYVGKSPTIPKLIR
ncbi:hypothetical protein HOLleu_20185 [Holothuria leucospilota]|uniref:Uncharacterized protein n=1 Tax=Holothuria leucospilota TaxID=206669 RepID=A0A9Q1C164_HOLLE|nr:hypothetical protein HOLleu_20185 [Holothuria leucospilota]